MSGPRLFVIGAALAAAGCGSSNPLADTWELLDGSVCSTDRLTFAADAVTVRSGEQSYYAGQEKSVPVAYTLDAPDGPTALSTDAAASRYTIGRDGLLRKADDAGCIFRRGG